MNTNGHYIVRNDRLRIRCLSCRYCRFSLSPAGFRKSGDRSGLPRYARARGEMVKHLHREHRTFLEFGPVPTVYNPKTGDWE